MHVLEKQPFNQVQLDLLTLFQNKSITESDFQEIRRILVRYFAEKAMDEADKVWEKEGWTQETVEELSNTHLRRKNHA